VDHANFKALSNRHSGLTPLLEDMQNFDAGASKVCHPLGNINAQPRCDWALRNPALFRPAGLYCATV
jgi:hypothetical protein